MEEQFDEARWQQLCADEASQRLQWQSAATYQDDPPPPAGLLRAWWGTVEQLLWAYVRGVEVFDASITLPRDLAAMLATTAGFLAVGDIIDPVSGVAVQGNLPANPLRRDLVGWATAYLKLVAAGAIDDRAPNKSVVEAYGVHRTTVQGWARLEVPPTNVAINPTYVKRKMLEAGKSYRQHGMGRW